MSVDTTILQKKDIKYKQKFLIITLKTNYYQIYSFIYALLFSGQTLLLTLAEYFLVKINTLSEIFRSTTVNNVGQTNINLFIVHLCHIKDT